MHVPVMMNEVVEYLDPKSNENIIDCTLGGGGHAGRMLEMTGPKGRLMGIDWDKDALKVSKKNLKKYGKRVTFVNGNFADIKELAEENGFSKVDGILMDVGMSSRHLEESGRGFTFRKDEPLDMRFDTEEPFTADKIVNFWNKHEIARTLKEYGEERYAFRIAEAIIEERRKSSIEMTSELVSIIEKAVPGPYRRSKNPHFAARTFQALRIAVNDELENIRRGLEGAMELLADEGRLVVISFHSLEDRIVKNQFRDSELTVLTKRPITASEEEIKSNSRSRSAKLRAIVKQ